MSKKYLLSKSIKKAHWARIYAKLIDFIFFNMISYFFYPLGFLLGLSYLCFADSLNEGQSLGKRLLGMNVISLEDGSPCSPKQSFIRNLPFTVPLFFTLIPFWGWIFSMLLIVPLFSLEMYFLFKLDSAHRLGDVMADTTVVPLNPSYVMPQEVKQSWY